MRRRRRKRIEYKPEEIQSAVPVPKIVEMYKTLKRQYGVKGYPLKFINYNGWYGFCHYQTKTKKRYIALSPNRLKTLTELELKDLIIHELAHAYVQQRYGRQNSHHNQVWRDIYTAFRYQEGLPPCKTIYFESETELLKQMTESA